MTPRLLSDADVPAAIALLAKVNLAAGAANIIRYLKWQPEGIWGCFEDGVLQGMVTVLHHGDVGFVGCMAVEPELQGRGMGRLLLEHAQVASRRAGVTTFLLEATPIGAQLYRKLGYVVEYETAIVSREATGRGEPLPLAEHRAAILELDRMATGSRRDVMIGGLVDNPEMFGAVMQSNGELAGYGLVVGERLGPLIARDPRAGRALVDRLAASCTTSTVPLANEPAVAALAANGFTETRRLERMRLGPAVPSRVTWIWALASAGAG
jgi:ribosomal protein S18 acetylase RimI-like enzyme